MKSFKQHLQEKWVEFDQKIAGNVDDPSFHPSQGPNTERMLKKLNKIMMKGKPCGCQKT